MKKIEQAIEVNATPAQVFEAWMDSEKHSAMTTGSAEIDPIVGGQFELWDGSISGSTIELVPNKKIVQFWKSDEDGWTPDHLSKITLELVAKGDKTTIHFTHEDIPDAVFEKIKQGWDDYYWTPMKKHFA